MKLAVVLFNLGGPDTLEAVGPFLKNLFSDPAIISLPAPLRRPLAAFIAKRRVPVAREIYAKLGGSSPIVPETERQARALEAALSSPGQDVKAFIAMRYWKPFSDETAHAVKAWGPDRIVLLPLYPQFSTTTTQSSLDDWKKSAGAAGISTPTHRVCCYPWDSGFVDASVALIRETMKQQRDGVPYRLLLSAHGLPERTVARGDPYRWQVEKTAEAIVAGLGIPDLDWNVCYQSRVGPLKWIGPATDAEIRRAGAEGKGVIVAPVAFVSEHSETLVELDIEYAHLAKASGVVDYLRAPTVGHHAAFIEGLARLVTPAVLSQNPVTCGDGRICPRELTRCGFKENRPMEDTIRNALADYIDWIKAFHVIAVIAWMSGMLYLPRLFVYHTQVAAGSAESERFKVMETKLLKAITNPAMIAVWILGPTLAWLTGAYLDTWLQIKFVLVIALSGVHGFLVSCWRKFQNDANTRPERFYRIINEVPAVLMVFIVILAVVKPFE